MKRNEKTLTITFEWHSLFRDIIRNIWTVVLAAAIGFMVVYVAAHSVYSPTYTSQATLVVRNKTTTYTTYTSVTISSEKATIYSNVFTQPAMKKLAAEKLGQTAFVGTLSAGVMEGTNIMSLSVTCSTPEMAYRELTAVLEVYPTISESIFADTVIDVIRTPVIPREPSNYMTLKNLAMVMGLCVLASLAIIIFISLLRDTVKTEKSFKEKIDGKLLGTIAYEKPFARGRLKRKMLINDSAASLKYTESFQKLATKLEYMHKREGAKVFMFTSVASNEGKTTAAINTAMALASRGNRVILFDMDFMKPAIANRLGVKVEGSSDFNKVLEGSVNIRDYKFIKYRKSSLYLALGMKKPENYQSWLEEGRVSAIVEKLKNSADFIIADSSPMSVSADTSYGIKAAYKTILVCRTDRVRAADINDAIAQISELGGHLGGCVLTHVYKEFSLFGQMGYDERGYSSGFRYDTYSYYGSKGGYNAYAAYSKKGYGGYGGYGKDGYSVSGFSPLSDLMDEDLNSSAEKNSSRNGAAANGSAASNAGTSGSGSKANSSAAKGTKNTTELHYSDKEVK